MSNFSLGRPVRRLLICLSFSLFCQLSQAQDSKKFSLEEYQLRKELEAMKVIMRDTIMNAKGNAMSLIYFWNSLQETQVEQLDSMIKAEKSARLALPEPDPVDTSIVSQIYQLLESKREEELEIAKSKKAKS